MSTGYNGSKIHLILLDRLNGKRGMASTFTHKLATSKNPSVIKCTKISEFCAVIINSLSLKTVQHHPGWKKYFKKAYPVGFIVFRVKRGFLKGSN